MDILNHKGVVTRKPHICSGCAREFPAGVEMDRAAVADGGDFYSSYLCRTCAAYSDRYLDQEDTWTEGELRDNDREGWEAVRQEVEGDHPLEFFVVEPPPTTVNGLKAYMGYGEDPAEGAILIFAHTSREAEKVGWSLAASLFGDGRPIDSNVRLIRESAHLFKSAEPEKLAAGEAHVVDAQQVCNECELWGRPIGEDGVCDDCRKDVKAGHSCSHQGGMP